MRVETAGHGYIGLFYLLTRLVFTPGQCLNKRRGVLPNIPGRVQKSIRSIPVEAGPNAIFAAEEFTGYGRKNRGGRNLSLTAHPTRD